MAAKSGRLAVRWGHLLLLAVIAATVIAYLVDARSVSLRVNNLLLVQPASILALVLVALVLPQCFVRVPEGKEAATETVFDLGRIFLLVAAFISFALLLEVVGFDLATFAFMVVALAICGEKRWWVNLMFSAAFTACLIYGYGAIIPFPFPLAVL